MAEITDHAPRPGPCYWDFRCLRCGEPVRDHAGLFRRLWLRFRASHREGTRAGE